MAKKRSKNKGDKPESLSPAQLADIDASAPSSLDPVSQAIQRATTEMAAVVISDLQSDTPPSSSESDSYAEESVPPSESDYLTVIPSSQKFEPQDRVLASPVIPAASSTGFPSVEASEEDVQVEILEELLDEDAGDDFIDDATIDEMVDSAFSNLNKLSDTPPEASLPPAEIDGTALIIKDAPEENQVIFEYKASKDNNDLFNFGDFDDDISAGLSNPPQPMTMPPPTVALPTVAIPPQALQSITPPNSTPTSLPPQHAVTVIPPTPLLEIENQIDLRQTGDYTRAAMLIREFFTSPEAEDYIRAEKKFERTKKITDKPDLEKIVRDFYHRKHNSK